MKIIIFDFIFLSRFKLKKIYPLIFTNFLELKVVKYHGTE